MTAIQSSSPSQSASPVPSTNPLPLSSTQEAQVRDLYYKRVRTKCADEIRLFAECARNKTFTATWKCRDQKQRMNVCMIGHATLSEQDAAREEWFATRDERVKEREEKVRAQEREKRKHHEWWGLDENGRRIRRDDGGGGGGGGGDDDGGISRPETK